MNVKKLKRKKTKRASVSGRTKSHSHSSARDNRAGLQMFPKRKTDLLWFLNLHSSLVPRLLFVISAGDGNTRIYWSRLWVLDFAASKFMGWILQYSDRLNVNKSRHHFVKVYISPLSVGLGSRVCRHECQKSVYFDSSSSSPQSAPKCHAFLIYQSNRSDCKLALAGRWQGSAETARFHRQFQQGHPREK